MKIKLPKLRHNPKRNVIMQNRRSCIRAIALTYETNFQIATNLHATSVANLLLYRCGKKKSHGTLQAQEEELGEHEMKRMQDMKINWKWFCVKELTAAESKSWFNRFNYDSRIYVDIYDAYKHPSEVKVSIWNEWVSWARDVNIFNDRYEVRNLSICAHSNQMFTVVAVIREFAVDETGNRIAVATYIMRVTKYHNYLYRLASDENGDDIDLCW